MAGKLIQVATSTVTSSTGSIKLTGITDNSVYMLAISNAQPTANADALSLRVLVGGTEDTSSNYDSAVKTLVTNTTVANTGATNSNKWGFNAVGNGTYAQANGIFYLYNFYESSEYSFITVEVNGEYANTGAYRGAQGGGVHTVAQSCNGIEFLYPAGQIAKATATLYRVV